MRYGKHTNLVQEVIDFIQHHELFESSVPFVDDITVINDYELAKQLAFSQDSRVVDVIWQDVKSNESASLFSFIDEEANLHEIDNELSEIFESADNYKEDFIPFDYLDISEEVESDLYKGALNRFIHGDKMNFYEKIFRCYQSGGWPCGWEGNYPQGEIVVYIPAAGRQSKEDGF